MPTPPGNPRQKIRLISRLGLLLWLALAAPAGGLETPVLLTELNTARRADGQPILRLDPELSRLAQERLQTFAERDAPEHRPEDATALGQLAADYDFAGWLVAENFSLGLDDPEMIVNAWLGSPSHRQNVLGARFTIAGVASAPIERNEQHPLLVVALFAGPPAESPETTPSPLMLLGLAVAALLAVWLIVRLQARGSR